jgi:exopolysaccharide production protein ExoQ
MPPVIASLAYTALILGLFWIDRDPKVRTSKALWLPVAWLMVVCSRPIDQWLLTGSGADTSDSVAEGSPLNRLFFGTLLVVGLVVLANRGKIVNRILRTNGLILFVFFYFLVSLVWSDFPDVAIKRWIRAVGDVVMVLIVWSDREPLAAIKRVLARTSYVLIPLSILFIKYYPNIGRGYGAWLGDVAYTGVTINKNTLGTICLCFGLGALWRFITAYQSKDAGRMKQMIAPGIILTMVFYLFMMINSMTSSSSFLMAGIVLIVSSFRLAQRMPMIVHLLVILMLTVSFSIVFVGASPELLKAMGRNPTLTDRTDVWAMVLGLVRDPVFGTGFESFWLGPRLQTMWARYWWHPAQAHNGYLEVYLNLGWIGLALLAAVLLNGYKRIFGAWRSKDVTGGLRLAYFYAGLVFNFTEAAFFRMQAPAWLFFLLAIVSVPAVPVRRTETPQQNWFQIPDSGIPEEVSRETV